MKTIKSATLSVLCLLIVVNLCGISIVNSHENNVLDKTTNSINNLENEIVGNPFEIITFIFGRIVSVEKYEPNGNPNSYLLEITGEENKITLFGVRVEDSSQNMFTFFVEKATYLNAPQYYGSNPHGAERIQGYALGNIFFS